MHAHDSLLHCDAVQAFGKLPVTLDELGADLISVSAHKLGGPPGVGALVVRPASIPEPRQRGGGQELGRRAGTLNLPAIVGFAAALDLATDWQAMRPRLRDRAGSGRAGAQARRPVRRVRRRRACRTSSCLVTPGLAGEPS